LAKLCQAAEATDITAVVRIPRALGSYPAADSPESGSPESRCAITTLARSANPLTAQAREFAEAYVAEDVVLQTARALAQELGLQPVMPGAGAALRLLAAAGSAKAVVEIGTGTGVSGVWLLRGMRPDGVLTTIDVEAEHQRLARRIFAEAGFAPSRTRIIAGYALDVVPRLADGVYDLVFVDAEVAEYGACVAAARRLLRPGGVLVVNGALAGGRIGDPAARDEDTVTIREVVKAMREADEWVPALLPAGHGLLCAVRR
jgi:predicted O-methyltransferase YrrM